MKTFLLIILGLGIGILAHVAKDNRAELGAVAARIIPPAITPAPPRTLTTPRLHYSGRIIQHREDGLLINCNAYKPYKQPKGTAQGDVLGDFLLSGYPNAADIPDEYEVEFYGHSDGVTTLRGSFGNRTLRQLVFAEEVAPAKAAEPWRKNAPVSSMRALGGGG